MLTMPRSQIGRRARRRISRRSRPPVDGTLLAPGRWATDAAAVQKLAATASKIAFSTSPLLFSGTGRHTLATSRANSISGRVIPGRPAPSRRTRFGAGTLANPAEWEVSGLIRICGLLPQRPGGEPVPGGKLQFWRRDRDYWAAGMGQAVTAHRGMPQTVDPGSMPCADDQQIVSPGGRVDQGQARASRRDHWLGPDTGREPAEGCFQCVPQALPGGALPHVPLVLRGELETRQGNGGRGPGVHKKQVGVMSVREIPGPAQRGQATRAAAHTRNDSPDMKHDDQPPSPRPPSRPGTRAVAVFYAGARDLACARRGSRMEIRVWRARQYAMSCAAQR